MARPSRDASTTSSKSIPPIQWPCASANPVNRMARLLSPRSKPLDEAAPAAKWASEKSAGIYCSILLRPLISPAHAPLLTLVAGLAAYDAAAEDLDMRPDIRWPNDLLVGGRKFCGILTEMHAEPDRVHYAVVGIGMNVNQAKMPDRSRRYRHLSSNPDGQASFEPQTSDPFAAPPRPLLQSVSR